MKKKYFKTNFNYFKFIKENKINIIHVTFTKNKNIKLIYN